MSEERAPAVDIQLVDQFADKRWRMSNLYYVLDERNREVPFRPNDMQLKFWDEMWYLNCILKGRQHGFTTFIDLFILDECLFYPNQIAGIIAHTLDDVRKIFRRKIRYPYEKLPAAIKLANPCTNDSAQELVFKNGSEISVGTTMRAGTLSYLHVSEFGYISSKFPEKAEEIVTGSFNTVHPGSYIFVESTGYGKSGHFYDISQRTRKHKAAQRKLTSLDFKYHFYPWHDNAKYQLPDEEAREVVFTKELTDYFTRIEKGLGKKLTFNQRAWYAKKKEWNGHLIYREHPSNDDEPFHAAIQGAIFQKEMLKAREAGRVTKVPHDPGLPVDTWWDLGRREHNAIWFVQTIGREVRFINFFEDELQSLPYYLGELDRMKRDYGYFYRHHIAPHDMAVIEYSTGKSRHQTAKEYGYNFTVAPQFNQSDQIDAGRNLIPMCYIDEENCADGIGHLEEFRFEWNEHLQQYMETYRHDVHSHASSALMTGAMMMGMLQRGRPRAQSVEQRQYPT